MAQILLRKEIASQFGYSCMNNKLEVETNISALRASLYEYYIKFVYAYRKYFLVSVFSYAVIILTLNKIKIEKMLNYFCASH